MKPVLGLPYQGSKRSISRDILDFIECTYPAVTTIVSPFCGGFSVEAQALSRGFNVIASDTNGLVVALLRGLLGLDENESLQRFLRQPDWVDRELFHEFANPMEGVSEAVRGAIRLIYSFGSDMRTYAYGVCVERLRRAQHEAIVYYSWEDFSDLGFSDKEVQGLRDNLHGLSLRDRRLALRRQMRSLSKNIVGSEAEHLRHLESLQHLRHLESLQRLERLESLQRLERLEISVCSYEETLAQPSLLNPTTLVYCDPPYAGTKRYQKQDFNHEKFWNTIRNLPLDVPVLVSEGSAPDDFVSVWQKQKVRTFSSHNNRTRVEEHLYTRTGTNRERI